MFHSKWGPYIPNILAPVSLLFHLSSSISVPLKAEVIWKCAAAVLGTESMSKYDGSFASALGASVPWRAISCNCASACNAALAWLTPGGKPVNGDLGTGGAESGGNGRP